MQRTLLIILALLLAGCAEKQPREPAPSAQKLWPEPPVSPRFMHEATLRYEDDLHTDSAEDRFRNMVMGTPRKRPAFQRPNDVAALYGRIYISDMASGLISVFDVPRRKFYRFGYRTEGKLVKPMGLALDKNANIYVADVAARVVQVFDFRGMHIRTIGAEDQLVRPIAVTVSPETGKVYVVDNGGIDTKQHRILIYDAEGKLEQILGKRGNGEAEFNLPTDAVVAPDGTLFVLDSGNFRVQTFDSKGVFLGEWGTVGKGLGQFARPRAIAMDAHQQLYITDTFFGNFQVFNAQGELLLPVGGINKNDTTGGYRLISGITADETGRIYVADQLFRKVEVFRSLSSGESQKLLREWDENNQANRR